MADKDSRAGVTYTNSSILEFCNRVHAEHDAGLERAFSAPDKHDMPAIQLGMSEGKLLELLTLITGATRAVEVGTLAGYSALRIARAMPEEGKVWTVEFNEHHATVAREIIAEAGFAERIEVVVGDAKVKLAELSKEGPFDLVFVDADKESYPEYGRWAFDNLSSGGLLVGDNAYLFGNLLEDTPRAAAMREFHEWSATHFDSVCVPTPDGMVIARKK